MAGNHTPAVLALQRAGVPFELVEYDYDPSAEAIGLHAAQALGRDAATVFKTLVVALDTGALVCAVIPSDARLDRKALAAAAKARKAELADPKHAERITGYVVGGISPFGQRKQLQVYLDASALDLQNIVVNGGRRGLQIVIEPADLIAAANALALPLTA